MKTQKGITLVEVMVAMVIGVTASLAMLQTFVAIDGNRKTTIYGNNAQASGALALYMLERDARMAGYALNSNAVQSCSTVLSYSNAGSVCERACARDEACLAQCPEDGAWLPSGGVRGIVISEGATSDQVEFLYGESHSGGVAETALRSSMPSSSAELSVESVVGCRASSPTAPSFAIAVQSVANATEGAPKCTVMEITHVQESALKLQHHPGQGNGVTYNPGVPFQRANDWPAYKAGDSITCMGEVSARRYSVQSEGLHLVAVGGEMPVRGEIVSAVVSLQAQYGVSAAPGGTAISQWVDASGEWANLTTEAWQRVRAVRFVVIARSNNPEPAFVSDACIAADGKVLDQCLFNDGASPAVSLGHLPNWQRYRYKVFASAIAPKNIMWGAL